MQEYTRQQLLHMIIAAKNGSLFCINTIYLLFYLIFNCTSYIVLLVRVCFHSGKFVFYYFLCTFDDLSRWSRVVLTPSSNHSCDRWVTGVQSNQMPVRVFPRRIISLLPPWRGSDLCACAHQRTRTRERRTKTAPITGLNTARAEWAQLGDQHCEHRYSCVCLREMSGTQESSGGSEHEAKRPCTRTESRQRCEPAEGDSVAVVSLESLHHYISQ